MFQISDAFSPVKITPSVSKSSRKIERLIVERSGAAIKIEPNTIIRSSVYSTTNRRLLPLAREFFEKTVQVQTLSVEDLYGGKICAALDRQHPRDLFDVKLLLENEGINDRIRTAFIVYLMSHNRPMYELLNPTFQKISNQFMEEFQGLTFTPITLAELNHAREELIKNLKFGFTEREKQFIISVKSMKPKWDLIELKHIKDLPAVRWKLHNLEKMDKKSHEKALNKLIRIFE